MKLVEIKTHALRYRFEEPFANSQKWHEAREVLVVQLFTDEGIVGWGEAHGPPIPIRAVIESLYRSLLIGQDPFDYEKIWEQLYIRVKEHGWIGIPISALSCIDIALWDIMGKKLKMPICKLLGGAFRSKVKAYATGMFYRDVDNLPKALAEEALQHINDGFKAVKMKIGFSPDHDYEYVEAVRKAIGEDTLLMVDANQAYDRITAIRLGRRIEKFNIYWFEEPVPPDDIEGYMEVKQALNMAIAGGETESTRLGFRDLISKRAVDIIQPDLGKAGGLTECRRIASMANAWSIRCLPHVFGTPLASAAALQFLASQPHQPYSLNPIEPMLEFDVTPHPFREELLLTPLRQRDGYVAVPSEPGLGVEVDEEAVRKYSVQPSIFCQRAST